MSGKTLQLTGPKAIAALIVIVGVIAFRQYAARTTLDTKGRAALQSWVQAEMIRPLVADTTQPLEDRGAAVSAAATVKIRSLGVRGRLNRAVVRVELEPSPALPPGAKLVRYYRMHYSVTTGWHAQGPATALNWYLAMF